MGAQRQRRRLESDGDRRRLGWSICPSRRQARTSTAGIARATICSPRALSPSSEDWKAPLAFPAGPPSDLDMDIASAPILEDITVGGKPIKAVSIMGKQAMVYVFDRATGQPVWPIEERPVPPSDVPGEKT